MSRPDPHDRKLTLFQLSTLVSQANFSCRTLSTKPKLQKFCQTSASMTRANFSFGFKIPNKPQLLLFTRATRKRHFRENKLITVEFLNVCSLNTVSQMMSTWEHTQIQLLFCSPEEKDFQSYKILNECYHQLLPETECLQDSRFLCCTKYSRPQGCHKTFHLHSIYWKEYLSDNCVVWVGLFAICMDYEFNKGWEYNLHELKTCGPSHLDKKWKLSQKKRQEGKGNAYLGHTWPCSSVEVKILTGRW